MVISIFGLGIYGTIKQYRKEHNGPIVSPKKITLYNGLFAVDNVVTIANPADLPVFSVTLKIAIKEANVRADSLNVHLTDNDVIAPK